MKNIVTIKNLDFSYPTKTIFKNFALNIKTSSITTIVGNNDSGKSTLAKILVGLEKTNADITIDKKSLNENIDKIRKIMVVIFNNPNDNFATDTVIEELAFTLENYHYNRRAIKERINQISKELKIEELLEREINTLSSGEKTLIAIASMLITEPKIVVFDEALSTVDIVKKEKIFHYLKSKQTTIINLTNDIEDSIYGDQLVLIDNGKVILNDETKKTLDNEKILAKYGFTIPFMHDLSTKLGYYELLDSKIYNIDDMVNSIWK